MESKLMFLVVCVIGCAVSCIKADGHLSTPTNLTSNITRNECGKTKLCLDNPKGCDPSGSSQCFFTSVQIILTTFNLTVELSGNSIGYIALAAGVTSSVAQGLNIIFVCGNNNGRFFFRTATLFNNTLLTTNVPNVNNIQGSIQPSLIQCVFSIPIDTNTLNFLSNVNATNVNISNIANSQLNVFLDMLQGSTNGTVLGEPKSVFGSSVPVDLANVNSTNVVDPIANSKDSISLNSLLSHAAICLLSIFLHLISGS
ncbi:putative ferric-chelate reductase 1 [Cyprinus carpio]|uniref:Ferric-chelate reductase 1 n=1 Tax=Cyprinus carpio TaxID=7962 RepID=A0A9Q9YWZ9_CYPCA|nr:putative ferric-chelate reductase 1 [Cyprinus carpio]